MSWQSLQTQVEKFSQIIKNESVNIEEFTEHPKNLLSLSKKISPLKMIGTRSKFYVEAPTSGESSPCLSESGKTPRFTAPSVLDIKGQTNHEEIIEVDYDIEKISNSSEKYPTLFIEGLDEFITIDDFDSILEGVRILTYEKNDIFVTKKSKFLNYKEKKCLVLKTLIKQPKLFARFIRKFQMHFKNMLGYGVSVSFAKMHRKISSVVNGVALRNIPPKITHEELKGQCSEGIDGKISVGQIQRIKDVNCCLVECDYLEDAEVICKKINKTRVRDAETKESFVIKAHIYPNNTLKYRHKQKSMFSDMLSVNSKTKSRSKPKLKRNDISRLIEIFANTKTLLENTNSENKVECDEYLYNKNFEETIVHSNQEKFKALKNDVYMTSFN